MMIRMIAVGALFCCTVPAITGAAPREPAPGHAAARASTTGAAAAGKEWARAIEDGWPDTPAGRAAHGWVRAFAKGEKAMREFLEANLTTESLASRPMAARLKSYRDLHERMGDLMLSSVAVSEPHELTVVLIAEDASPHRFVFTVGPTAPHRLLKVGILQEGHGHGSH